MGKRSKSEDEAGIRKKIRRLEKKLKRIPNQNSSVSPPPQSPRPGTSKSPSPPREELKSGSGPSPVPLVTEQEQDLDEIELPDEFLQALGNEGRDIIEVGDPIRPELTERWSGIMCKGLGKDAKELIVKKYPMPQNFPRCRAPLMNPEITAAMSGLAIKRDRRIMARQELTGKLMTCLGKSLTNVLKGNLITKSLIEEMSDAAKMAAEIFYEDSSSRRFFALTGTNINVKEAIEDSKPDKYLFGEDCSEKIKSAQAVRKTSTQIKSSELGKPPPKGPNQVSNVKRQGNWRGPPQRYQHQPLQARGGQRTQPSRKFHQNQNPAHQRDQRRNQHKFRSNHRKHY